MGQQVAVLLLLVTQLIYFWLSRQVVALFSDTVTVNLIHYFLIFQVNVPTVKASKTLYYWFLLNYCILMLYTIPVEKEWLIKL